MSSSSPSLTPPTSDSESETDKQYCNGNSHYQNVSAQFLSRTIPISTSSPHPFAGSTKANRPPPSYEKKLSTPPPEPFNKIKTRDSRREPPQKLFHTESSLSNESEQSIWDMAVSSAIDRAEPKIDLSGNNLTQIPSSIIDLKNLVVLPKIDRGTQNMASRVFTRSITAPALLPSPHIPTTRRFTLAKTMNAFCVPAMQGKHNRSRCEIEMYLMGNAIRALPRELFGLDCLVVLSLRQNKLTSLPPAIGQLTRLRELNVASNRLAHLPAELLNLRLTSLHLHPNPFIPPPNLPDAKLSCNFSPLRREASLPTLSEFALRCLLGPATSKSRIPTWLEEHMEEIPDRFPLPDHFQRIIRASTRHSLASEKIAVAEEDVTANVCPNPVHVRSRFFHDTGISGKVFYKPVETRMEWVGVVAGVQVAENPKAWVPVLWRGCSKGCLAFLEPQDLEESANENVSEFVAGAGEGGELFEFSDEE